MKRTAAILMCFGLALLGFASAAYSGASKHTDATGTSTCSISAITNASLSVSGNAAQATFTVRSDCDAVEVSLVSYTMPGPAFDENTADQQALSASTTVTVGAGSHTLSLAVPNCFYQVDFVVGQPLQTLGPAGSGNFYSSQGRYIASATGGSTPCSTTTTTTTTATTTTTPAMTTPTTTTEATTTAPGTTTTTTSTNTPGTTTAPVTTTTGATVPPTTATATTTTAPPTTAPPTTTAPFVPPPTSTATTTTSPSAVTTTGRTTTTKGPFTPPPLQPPGPPQPAGGGPGLPFTGVSLGLAALLGILLVTAGLALHVAGRPVAAPSLAFAGGATGPRMPSPSRFVAPRSPVKARIFVPGVGAFDSIDDAERRQLDLRWARQGARFLGHREERREP